MKKNLIRIAALTTIFAFGLGLSLTINKQPVRNEAAQYIDNFDNYVYSGSYYSGISETAGDGLNGELRTALTSLIYPKDWYTYGSSGDNHLSTQLQYADEDPTNPNNMIYFYTRDSVTKNAASSWNREHVWPQSLSNDNYGTDDGAGSDVLHIRPTYNSTNSQRGSLLMGDVNKSGAVIYNGMTYGYIKNSKFEPIDSVKGDVARIFMYVWTAYRSAYSNRPLNLLSAIESYDTLLKWHTLDKPDVLEGHRNDYAEQSVQKNRNPFVDHPEYAWKIFGDSASSSVKEACIEAYPGDGSLPQAKIMTGISISGKAIKTEYYVGQSFDPAGLTVTANYDDDSAKTIPASNCTWTPNPLVEGTSEVTCTYNGFSAKYSGITVIARDTPGGVYSVEFLTTADSGTDVTASTISSQWKNNTLVESVSDLSKVYPGEKGLKLGSSKANGKITFNLKNDAQNNIIRVAIQTTQFSGSAYYTVKLGNTTIGSGVEAGSLFQKELNKESASKLTIESNGRLYLNSISVEIYQSSQSSSSSQPPISSSSVPPTSSESSSSAYSESSSSSSVSSEDSSSSISSEYSSSSASNSEASSSSLISSSESSTLSSTTSSVEASSSEIISEQSTSEQTSSSFSNESSEPKKSTGGCHGSILGAVSLAGFTALIGLVFVLSKKK